MTDPTRGRRMSRVVRQADGSTLTRRQVELDRAENRFTISSWTEPLIGEIRSLDPLTIEPITAGVAKVVTDGDCEQLMTAVREMGGVAHHAYRPGRDPNATYYITDTIFVRTRDRAPAGQVDAVFADLGLDTVTDYPDGRTHLLQVTSRSRENPVKVCNRLEAHTSQLCEWAEPNMVNRFLSTTLRPSDPYFNLQWHLFPHDSGGNIAPHASVDAVGGWEALRRYGSGDIVVAVVDDGFDLEHPDLAHLTVGMDFTDGNAPPQTGESNPYHGTACAGLIAALANGGGHAVGVAPGCSTVLVRMPMTIADSTLRDLFARVGATADVLSCSWKIPSLDARTATLVLEELDRITREGGSASRSGRGCVVCFAAGNESQPINSTGEGDQLPTSNALAASPLAIAVTATTHLGEYADYNNYGPEAWVSGPSSNYRLFDRHESDYVGIVSTDDLEGINPTERYTGSFGGTSAANAIVAGVAALVLSANKDLDSASVRKILAETAVGVASTTGRPFGRGLVNAPAAIARATRYRPEAEDPMRDDPGQYPLPGPPRGPDDRFEAYLDDLIPYLVSGFGAGLGGPKLGQAPIEPDVLIGFVNNWRRNLRNLLVIPVGEESRRTPGVLHQRASGKELDAEKVRRHLYESFIRIGMRARELADKRGMHTVDARSLKEANDSVKGKARTIVERKNRRDTSAGREVTPLGSLCK